VRQKLGRRIERGGQALCIAVALLKERAGIANAAPGCVQTLFPLQEVVGGTKAPNGLIIGEASRGIGGAKNGERYQSEARRVHHGDKSSSA
jgi:hypothetical protein